MILFCSCCLLAYFELEQKSFSALYGICDGVLSHAESFEAKYLFGWVVSFDREILGGMKTDVQDSVQI